MRFLGGGFFIANPDLDGHRVAVRRLAVHQQDKNLSAVGLEMDLVALVAAAVGVLGHGDLQLGAAGRLEFSNVKNERTTNVPISF